jgi:hypothetical protein
MTKPSFAAHGEWVVVVPAIAKKLGVEYSEVRVPIASSSEFFVSQELDKNWVAAFRILNKDGSLVVGEVRIFPRERLGFTEGHWSGEWLRPDQAGPRVPGSGVTSSVFAKIDWKAIRTTINETVAGWVRRPDWEPFFAITGFGKLKEPPAILPKKKLGRSRLPDDEYLDLCNVYVQACKTSHRPVKETADRLGIDVSVCRNRLYKARKFGFLTPGRPSLAQGQLTPQTKQLLLTKKRGQKRAQKTKKR